MKTELTTAQKSHIEIARLEECKQITEESVKTVLHLQSLIGKLIENDFVSEMFDEEIREAEMKSYKIIDCLAKIAGYAVINSLI